MWRNRKTRPKLPGTFSDSWARMQAFLPSPCPSLAGRSGLFPSPSMGTHSTEFLESQKNLAWAAREQSEHTWLHAARARGSERGFRVSEDTEQRKLRPRGPIRPHPHCAEFQRGLGRWSHEVRNSHLLPPPHHALLTTLLRDGGSQCQARFQRSHQPTGCSGTEKWVPAVLMSVCLSQGRFHGDRLGNLPSSRHRTPHCLPNIPSLPTSQPSFPRPRTDEVGALSKRGKEGSQGRVPVLP